MDDIGILDIKGKNKNPLTNNKYSDEYKKWALIWSKYPAYEKATEIINSIKENQIILITSGTGSGKTVLLPKFCLHVLNYSGKIAVTLPKQLIAKSSAEFAAKTLDVKLGHEVGYKYKGSVKSGLSDKTKLLFATDGTIVAKLLNDPELREFDAVIIDEAHERKVQIDILLYLLKQTCKLRPEFKLIIMSATVNEDIFYKYYSEFKFNHFDVGGKTNYPIESIFLDTSLNPKPEFYLKKGYEIIDNIFKTTTEGDILFFVTSVNETFEMCKKVYNDNIYCVEVFAGMKSINQDLAQDEHLYKDKSNKTRKLVIATNVAESSLTISNIKFVIDSGFELFSYYDADKRAKVLERKLITRAQATQRMGRAGRTSSGICYHLYTKSDFNSMDDYPQPTIKVSDLSGECLNLLNLPTIKNVDDLKQLLNDFIEPPTKKYIDDAISTLTGLNLVNYNVLTDLGKTISSMNLEPIEGVAIYNSYKLHCSKEVIAIFSMISAIKNNINELFTVPAQIQDESSGKDSFLTEKFKKAKRMLSSKKGDHIALLKIFNKYLQIKKNEDKLNKWTYENFLKKDVLRKALDNFRKIRGLVMKVMENSPKLNRQLNHQLNASKKKSKGKNDNRDGNYNTNIENNILESLSIGYQLNIAILKDRGYSTQNASNIQLSNDSWMKLYNTLPKQIMFHELFMSSNRISAVIVSVLY